MPSPVEVATTWQQPSYYPDFKCAAGACLDSCCVGMRVAVDEKTYHRYLALPENAPVRQPGLVQLRTDRTPEAFAVLEPLVGGRCALLTQEQMCSVQGQYGSDYLSDVCYTYPRVVSAALAERSLDLSCPEVVRLVVGLKGSIELQTVHEHADTRHITCGISPAKQGGQDNLEVRSIVLSELQNQSQTLRERIARIARYCDFLGSGQHENAEPGPRISPDDSIALILNIILERFRLDYVGEKFRALFLMTQDKWETMRLQPNAELFPDRPYLLENLLFVTALNSKFPDLSNQMNVSGQCRVLVARFTVLLALLQALTMSQVEALQVNSIQVDSIQVDSINDTDLALHISCISRALEHCVTFAPRILKILDDRGLRTASDCVQLLR